MERKKKMEKILELRGCGKNENVSRKLLTVLLILAVIIGVTGYREQGNETEVLKAEQGKTQVQELVDEKEVKALQIVVKSEAIQPEKPTEILAESAMSAADKQAAETISMVNEESASETITAVLEEPILEENSLEKPQTSLPENAAEDSETQAEQLENRLAAATFNEAEKIAIVPVVPAQNETEESSGRDFLRAFLIDGEGMIYGVVPDNMNLADGRMELPSEGCIGIRAGAFLNAGAGVEEVFIPSNITQIEAGAFVGLDELFYIETEAGNINYTSVDGVLFHMDRTVLFAFPSGRVGGYVVPKGVVRIEKDAFYNSNLAVLDTRACENLDTTALEGCSMTIL